MPDELLPSRYRLGMLIIAGEIRLEPGTRDDFFAAVAPMVRATRREPGCRAYAFTPDPDDATLIRLWELWDDEEALAGHFASDHMTQWQERARDLPITGRDLHRYAVADVSPLGA